MNPKVLLIIGDATETVDTLYPFYRLIEGGYTPIVAAILEVAQARAEVQAVKATKAAHV
jgi:putative intracellular protease/amidase